MSKNKMVTNDGHKISVGDVLRNEDGYFVVVCQYKSGGLYGSLLCSVDYSCRNIPYSLNNGKGHYYTGIKIEHDQAVDFS